MQTVSFQPTQNLEPSDGAYKIPALRVLSEIATSLSTENDLEALLERFLGTMVKLAGADAGAVRVLTAEGAHLRLVGSLGLPPEIVEQEEYVELECGLCGEATRKSSHRHSANVHFCSERNSHSYFGSRCKHIIAVPLRYQGKVLGVYNLFMASDNAVPEDVALLFDSISEHLGMALENARLTRENMRITLMNERQMLANELHDSLAQTLAYMRMRVSLLRDSMEKSDAEASSRYLEDVSEGLDTAYSGLRELLTHFRNRMDPRGLLPALQDIVNGFFKKTGIFINFANLTPDLKLTPDQEVQVFHIVQEALANINKHSRAQDVSLTISQDEDNHYLVSIEDDGVGIPSQPDKPENGQTMHFGLNIMHERAQRLGGTIQIECLPNRGSRVQLRFPPSKKDHAK
ncbi:MAG: histidine kinase [Sulfuricellaceae bacterium]|nr:histidine kinase [Sulfuricellaceae bacterium]